MHIVDAYIGRFTLRVRAGTIPLRGGGGGGAERKRDESRVKRVQLPFEGERETPRLTVSSARAERAARGVTKKCGRGGGGLGSQAKRGTTRRTGKSFGPLACKACRAGSPRAEAVDGISVPSRGEWR